MTGHTARSEGDWAFWRPAVLRAPGFDSRQGTRLCSPLAVAAADRLGTAGQAAPDWAAYQAIFAAETVRLGTVIRQIAREPRFQFALASQFRQALDAEFTAIAERLAARAGWPVNLASFLVRVPVTAAQVGACHARPAALAARSGAGQAAPGRPARAGAGRGRCPGLRLGGRPVRQPRHPGRRRRRAGHAPR